MLLAVTIIMRFVNLLSPHCQLGHNSSHLKHWSPARHCSQTRYQGTGCISTIFSLVANSPDCRKEGTILSSKGCTGIFISFSCLPRGWVYSRTHILTESLHPGHATWPAPDSHSTITLHKHIAGSHHRHTPTAWSRGASLQHSEEGKKGKAGRENSWDLPTAYQNTGSWSGCLPPAYPVLVNVQYLPVPISPQPIHLWRASLSSSSRPRTILGVTSMPRTKESWKHHEEKSWGKDRAILANISRSKTC